MEIVKLAKNFLFVVADGMEMAAHLMLENVLGFVFGRRCKYAPLPFVDFKSVSVVNWSKIFETHDFRGFGRSGIKFPDNNIKMLLIVKFRLFINLIKLLEFIPIVMLFASQFPIIIPKAEQRKTPNHYPVQL